MKRMMTLGWVGLLLAGLLSSGCSTSSMLVGQPRPPIDPSQVRVYYTPPSVPYEQIAVIETASGPVTYGEQNKLDSVLNKLRQEAAKVGANGVLLQGTASGYGGTSVGVGTGVGRYGGSSYSSGGIGVSVTPRPKYATGVAIHVPNPPPETPSEAPPEPPAD